MSPSWRASRRAEQTGCVLSPASHAQVQGGASEENGPHCGDLAEGGAWGPPGPLREHPRGESDGVSTEN